MVIVRTSSELNKRILEGGKVYLYGAGKLYRKVISVIQDDVIAVVDRKYDEIEPENDIRILSPHEVFCVSGEFHVVSALDPYCKYRKRTKELAQELLKYSPAEINLYMVDVDTLEECGVLRWGDAEYLYDNQVYVVGGKSEFVKKAYSPYVEADIEYLKKLNEEPYAFVLRDKSIGLEDFNNGLIIHSEGRKDFTINPQGSPKEKRILLFGDSRVSGFMLENRHTIGAYLQLKINELGWDYGVLNYAIPGRDIERMVWQIENTSINANDIIILASGFYEYDGNADLNVLVWAEYIQMAYKIVNEKKAVFLYINLPTILEMNHYSEDEKQALNVFNTTEFVNYTPELIGHYKRKLQIECASRNVLFLDAATAFSNRQEYGQVFINMHHYGPTGSRLISDFITDYLKVLITSNDISVSQSAKNERERRSKAFEDKLLEMRNKDLKIEAYAMNLRKRLEEKWGKEYGGIGCIVMNANPFTNGHLYLVEEALKSIGRVLVLVVSEDESDFSFKDRFRIVKLNLENYENVAIAPSGEYCISRSTFPDYFDKGGIQEDRVNMDDDVRIFRDKLAPMLGIKKRFVGEEPFDVVTKQYNETMKKMFCGSEVSLVEIPRKKKNGTFISASFVRKLVSDDGLREAKDYVPEATYNYLFRMRNK
jgi:cytidyltransferase-like protein